MNATPEWKDTLSGEWAVSPAGSDEITAILDFEDDGTVTNTVTQSFGKYYILPDGRIHIEFPDSFIIGDLKQRDNFIMVSGFIAVPQPLNLVLNRPTEENASAAEERLQELVKQQEEVQKEYARQAILNNLRQFVAAAQQYMLDEGDFEVDYDKVVGPGKLIETLVPVDGEDYTGLKVSVDDTSISVTTRNDDEVSYAF